MKQEGRTNHNPGRLQIAPELEEIQGLMPIEPDDLERLRADIQAAGEVRDSLKAYTGPDGDLLVFAGLNRLKIAQDLGLATVPVTVYEGTPEEIRELAIKDNLNRRHFTREQKRKLIEYFLKTDPEQSNKSVARKTGATKETVKQTRQQLETGGEIRPLEKRRGSDGKDYTTQQKERKPEQAPPALGKADYEKIHQLVQAAGAILRSKKIRSHLTAQEIRQLDHIADKLHALYTK